MGPTGPLPTQRNAPHKRTHFSGGSRKDRARYLLSYAPVRLLCCTGLIRKSRSCSVPCYRFVDTHMQLFSPMMATVHSRDRK